MVLAQWYVDTDGHPARLARPRLVAALGALTVGAAIWAKQAELPGLAVVFIDLLTLGLSLVVAALLALPSGLLRGLFANRPIQLLGMMCFSIYVWHEPLLRHVFRDNVAPLDGLARTLPVYLTLLAAIAALSYRFIEFGRVADWRGLFLLASARTPGVPSRSPGKQLSRPGRRHPSRRHRPRVAVPGAITPQIHRRRRPKRHRS